MSRAARVGFFILAALTILISGIFIIGGKQYLFTPTYQLNTQFSSVVGLDAGAEVRVGGVHTGSVRSVELPTKPTDKITVRMDLEKSSHNIIKKDSIASIETEGLLGNKYVAISFGTANSGNVVDGGMIGSETPIEMSDIIKKADGILDSSQVAMKSVDQATANLSSISSKINNGQGTIGSLVNDKKIYTQLDQTTAGLRDTVAKAQTGVTDFQENMEALKKSFLLRGFFKNRGYEDSADLAKYEIPRLPGAEPLKTFAYDPKQLFDKVDTAKAKNQKLLRSAGQFLADNEFGVAVIQVSTGMQGDAEKDRVLAQARATVIRDYLVDNFGFNDSELKTFGVGKMEATGSQDSWGLVTIIVYPPGTDVPATQQTATERQ